MISFNPISLSFTSLLTHVIFFSSVLLALVWQVLQEYYDTEMIVPAKCLIFINEYENAQRTSYMFIFFLLQ